jgi:3D (Asp-Asp-Asp) domain-containing protein
VKTALTSLVLVLCVLLAPVQPKAMMKAQQKSDRMRVTVKKVAESRSSRLKPIPQRKQLNSRSESFRTLRMLVTAYDEVGLTASGLPTGPGRVAVDPKVIPLGTRMYIPGYGWARAEDTGRLIKGNRVDVWIGDHEKALEWGVRWEDVIVEDGRGNRN